MHVFITSKKTNSHQYDGSINTLCWGINPIMDTKPTIRIDTPMGLHGSKIERIPSWTPRAVRSFLKCSGAFWSTLKVLSPLDLLGWIYHAQLGQPTMPYLFKSLLVQVQGRETHRRRQHPKCVLCRAISQGAFLCHMLCGGDDSSSTPDIRETAKSNSDQVD